MGDLSVQFDKPDFGQTESFTLVNVYENGVESSRTGEPGLYSVTFILGSTFHSTAASTISMDMTTLGDSFLQFWDPKIRHEQILGAVIEAQNPDGSRSRCEIRTNSEGRMAQICFPEIHGESFDDAESKAYGFVQPILTWVSYQYELPVEVSQVYSVELNNSTIRTTTYVSPRVKGLSAQLPLVPTMMPPAIMECIGQYREAMNSTNEFYRLFCLFRSAEGLKHIRTKLDDMARLNALFPLQARSSRKRIPMELASEVNYRQLANKTLLEARDFLWNEIRSHLAHLDFETGKFLSLHSYQELTKVRRIIPLVQYIVKHTIAEEILVHDEIKTRLGITTNFLTWADDKESE